MPKFRLYAGLGGGFGGARYQGTFECADPKSADKYAYNLAWEEYESYGGSHGLFSWEDCYDALKEDDYPRIPSDDEVNDYYTSEVEDWIEWYAEPAPNDAPEWEEEFDE